MNSVNIKERRKVWQIYIIMINFLWTYIYGDNYFHLNNHVIVDNNTLKSSRFFSIFYWKKIKKVHGCHGVIKEFKRANKKKLNFKQGKYFEDWILFWIYSIDRWIRRRKIYTFRINIFLLKIFYYQIVF